MGRGIGRLDRSLQADCKQALQLFLHPPLRRLRRLLGPLHALALPLQGGRHVLQAALDAGILGQRRRRRARLTTCACARARALVLLLLLLGAGAGELGAGSTSSSSSAFLGCCCGVSVHTRAHVPQPHQHAACTAA